MTKGRKVHGIWMAARVALTGFTLAGCSTLLTGVVPEPTATPLLNVAPDARLTEPPGPPTTGPTDELPPPTSAQPTGAGPTAAPTFTPSPFPSPTMAPGWTVRVVPQAGYAISLPPTWLILPLDGQNATAVLAQIQQDDPALALSLGHGLPDGMLDTIHLMAFDSAAALQDAPFVSTLRIGQAPLNDYHQAAAQRSAALDADPTSTLTADWPESVGFEELRGRLLRYTSLFPPEAPQLTVHHTQVYVETRRGEVLVITFSTEAALRQGYEHLFELVLDTVHLTSPETS